MDYVWIEKRVEVGSPDWLNHVKQSPICPDQRLYRRATRAERERYYHEIKRRK